MRDGEPELLERSLRTLVPDSSLQIGLDFSGPLTKK
jgi:hypothetical protein